MNHFGTRDFCNFILIIIILYNITSIIFDFYLVHWMVIFILICAFCAPSVYESIKNSEQSASAGIMMIFMFPLSVLILSIKTFMINGLHKSGDFIENPDFFDCLYLTIITWTTVGYGDYLPSDETKLLSLIVGISGYIFSGYFLAISFKIIGSINSKDLI